MSVDTTMWLICATVMGCVVFIVIKNIHDRVKFNNGYTSGTRMIVKTQLLDKHSPGSTVSTSATSAIGRGVAGGLVAGPAGAIIGAGTARKKVTPGNEEYTFRVYWSNREVTVEKCRYGDWMYNKCIEKLEVRE